jgi:hypothetical protein
LLLLPGLLALLILEQQPSRPTDLVVDATTQPSAGPSEWLVRLDVGVRAVPASNTACEFGRPSFGAACENDNGNLGLLADLYGGVVGRHPDGDYGILGSEFYGVYGESQYGPYGYLGGANTGVYGVNVLNDTYGALGDVLGGAYGHYNYGPYGALGTPLVAVYGSYGINESYGFLGTGDFGVYGEHGANEHHGSIGGSFYGTLGRNANDNRGYLGHDMYGVWGTGSPYAGYFMGDVEVTGTLTQSGAASKVDHPLDPANRYLSHSFVESPDMMNVYNGNVVTDENGQAVVELPAYVEALDRDFRYQLTVLGTFAQAIVAEKIQDNRFVIRTDQPDVEVSWQVTGIRHDPWAEAHRLVVEEDKLAEERGYYLHPALYGQPDTRSVAWVRDPEGMRAVEAMPARLETQRRRMEQQRQHLDEERQQMLQERARLRQARPRQ